MKKIAFAVMTAALLGACSSRSEEGAAQDSAAAGAAVGSGAVTDTTMGGMTDTTMGGTTGTAGVGTTGTGDTTRRDSATTPPPR